MTSEQWRRVFALVRASHAENESQRPSFLRANCADDKEVLEAAQSLLLQMGASFEHPFDEHTAVSPAEGVDLGPEQTDLRFPRGSAFGRYVVLDLLGKGGMGVVFAAYDPELDRKVAIKVISPEWSQRGEGTDGRARLLREAKAMARLSHVNVITVYDVGVISDEVFISMEYVDGGTLKNWLAQPRGWREILEMFVQAGRGLSAAHSAGIVHRDFKPQNVLVGKDGRVRVLDFGVARGTVAANDAQTSQVGDSGVGATSSAHTPLVQMTKTGALIGTPAYMAPEQLAGRPIDARTDQFSFCAALYEALYGELPFEGDTLPERLNTIEQGRLSISRPSSSVPRWLREVLARGLSANPEARYPSMDALLYKLQRNPRQSFTRFAVASLVLLAAGTGWSFYRAQYSKRQMCRGAEEKLASVWNDAQKRAVSAAFLGTGVAYAADAVRGVNRALDDYARRWIAMQTEACEATYLRGEQSGDLLDLRTSCLSQRREELKALAQIFATADSKVVEKAVTAAQGLSDIGGCGDAEALRAPVKPPADASVRAKVEETRLTLSRVRALNEAGKSGEARPLATQAVEDARRLQYLPLEAEALLALGLVLVGADDLRQSEEVLLKSALAAESSRHDEVAAHAWAATSFSSMILVKYEQAEIWGRIALATLERTGGNDRLLSLALNNLGLAHMRRGKYDESLDDYRAVAAGERAQAPIEVSRSLNNMGLTLARQEKYEEALVQFERAHALQEKSLGADHPKVGSSLMNMGVMLKNQGKYDQALAYYRRSLDIKEKSLGRDHSMLATNLENIGNILTIQEKYQEALESFERARLLTERSFGRDHPNVAVYLRSIGGLYVAWGRPADAVPVLERALAISKSVDREAVHYCRSFFDLAQAFGQLKKEPQRRRTLAEQARECFRGGGEGKNKADLAEIEKWLAKDVSRASAPGR